MTPVLIIGSGISGLCLAQGLKKLNIEFKVFEKDPSVEYRGQGYRVRVIDGIDVISKIAPPHVAKLYIDTCPIMDRQMISKNAITGEALPPPFGEAAHKKMVTTGTPSIFDRQVFRKVFMTDIADKVHFDKAFSHYELDEEGVTAFFADGSSERGHLIVGADGKKSPVARQYIPKQVTLDTGGRIFYGKSPLTPQLEELAVQEKWGGLQLAKDRESLPTMLSMLAETIRWSVETRSAIQQAGFPSNYIYWVLVTQASSLPVSEHVLANKSKYEAAASAVLYLTKGWKSELRKIFEGQDIEQTALFNITSADPDMEPWKPCRFVTLVGDAVHHMPPTGASGANTALKDVENLLGKIETNGIDGLTEEIIGQYECEMRELAATNIRLSFQGGIKAFGLKSLDDCKRISRA
jgi:2-polyprenyl-6-methoxyphenol hydroxylase-like FAD-dependent oxidoreductase